VELTRQEKALNVFQGLIRGIPYIEEGLEQMFFSAQELRIKGFEATLCEAAAIVKDRAARPGLNAEELANLLEDVLPRLARSISEDARARFRDPTIGMLITS
jgi:hypothetical protein